MFNELQKGYNTLFRSFVLCFRMNTHYLSNTYIMHSFLFEHSQHFVTAGTYVVSNCIFNLLNRFKVPFIQCLLKITLTFNFAETKVLTIIKTSMPWWFQRQLSVHFWFWFSIYRNKFWVPLVSSVYLHSSCY